MATNKTLDEIRLEVYEKTINEIQDYFEYRHDSDRDKAYVMSRMDLVAIRINNKLRRNSYGKE